MATTASSPQRQKSSVPHQTTFTKEVGLEAAGNGGAAQHGVRTPDRRARTSHGVGRDSSSMGIGGGDLTVRA